MESDGSYAYRTNKDYTGLDSFTYWMTDVEGDSDTAKINITVKNTVAF